ncbi:MAG: hypothetical protein C4547_16205 [Phycisphaerales bacterium]|nr:MAG: hypothetical protein C4547_16205 [Phycisphaerales bacterium]
MLPALTHADAFLHGRGAFDPARPAERPWWWLPVMIAAFAALYGVLMGSFRLDDPSRLLQVLYSAVKMPLLLLATSGLCLPGFFVLTTIVGLRDDLRESLQAILAGQAGLSIALASLGPLTRLWYFSTTSYRAALLFNAAVFLVATLAGHLVTLRYYRVLIRRNPRHRIILLAWLALYAFVGIQMGWTMRPFVGAPGMAVTFFRQEAFSNAYVVVFELVFGA